MASTLRGFADANARFKPTIGDTKTSAVKNDHMGWLKCDGRNLNTSDYAHLFSVLKYAFGGSGSFFKLPNAVGRVPGFVGRPQDQNDRVQDGGVDIVSPYGTDHPLGDVSGEEVHQLTVAELPAHNHDICGGSLNDVIDPTANGFTSDDGLHTHGITDPSHNHNIITANAGSTVSGRVGQGGDDALEGPATTQDAQTGITINEAGEHNHQIASNGDDQPHNNIQPTIWIGNLFIYGGRPWAVATPQSRKLQGANPAPNSNYYPPQGPILNLY